MAGVVLKVRFKEELHRLTLEKIITFSELENILTDFFGVGLPAHSIKYAGNVEASANLFLPDLYVSLPSSADEDDDMITISSDIELKEAIQYATNHSKLLRLCIFGRR